MTRGYSCWITIITYQIRETQTAIQKPKVRNIGIQSKWNQYFRAKEIDKNKGQWFRMHVIPGIPLLPLRKLNFEKLFNTRIKLKVKHVACILRIWLSTCRSRKDTSDKCIIAVNTCFSSTSRSQKKKKKDGTSCTYTILQKHKQKIYKAHSLIHRAWFETRTLNCQRNSLIVINTLS